MYALTHIAENIFIGVNASNTHQYYPYSWVLTKYKLKNHNTLSGEPDWMAREGSVYFDPEPWPQRPARKRPSALPAATGSTGPFPLVSMGPQQHFSALWPPPPLILRGGLPGRCHHLLHNHANYCLWASFLQDFPDLTADVWSALCFCS